MADPPILGLNRPYPKNPLDPNDPNYDPVLDPHNNQYNPNDPRLVGGVSPYVLAHGQPPMAPPLTGPQQSYAGGARVASSAPQGQNGAALRQDTDFNYSPYTPTSQSQPVPEGPRGNTGAPQANSQAELVGRGGAGWNIYQTTPTWTGSPLSQSPPARDEGDFRAPAPNAPALNAPQMPNPALLRFAQSVHPLLRQFLSRG